MVALFGAGYELTKKSDLSQPGQFVMKQLLLRSKESIEKGASPYSAESSNSRRSVKQIQIKLGSGLLTIMSSGDMKAIQKVLT